MTIKNLSRRPLKRSIVFEVQCGPYTAFRDGQDRPRQSYVIWTSDLPRGAKSRRFVAILQQVNRPDSLGDRVHNPVLYQRIALLPKRPFLAAKQKRNECVNGARHALYWLLDGHLKTSTLLNLLRRVTLALDAVIGRPTSASSSATALRSNGRLRRSFSSISMASERLVANSESCRATSSKARSSSSAVWSPRATNFRGSLRSHG